MKGIVTRGKKEGKKYMEMEGYRIQFLKKLHIDPYPGTLNLFVGKNFVNDLKNCEGIVINGFVEKGKKYGKVNCFPIRIYNEQAFIVVPEKSRYADIIEIIAEKNLREKYGIKDGDEVEFNFEPFIKRHNKIHLYAIPSVGKGTARVTIFYDEPFKKGRRDLCYFKRKGAESEYKKTIVGKDVASILFVRDAKNSYRKLMNFIKEKNYSIMSPVRKIKYSKINEWQVEIKAKPD